MTIAKVLKLLILPVIGMVLIGLPLVEIVRIAQKAPVAVVTAPGHAAFKIDQPTKVTVWRKNSGISADNEFRVRENKLPVGLSIRIQNLDSNTTVPIFESTGATMTSNDIERTSLIKAELHPGNYQIAVNTSGEELDLEVRTQVFNGVRFLTMIAGSFLGGILFLIGVLYGIAVIIREVIRKPAPTQPHP